MHQERQTSARLIIAAVALVLPVLLQLLPVTECVWEHSGGDPHLNGIYFNVLMSEGMDLNARITLLQKALGGVGDYVERKQAADIRRGLGEKVEYQLAQVLSLIHHNLVQLELADKTRTQVYEQLLRIIQPIVEGDLSEFAGN